MRVLVVEDERKIALFLKRGLAEAGHEVLVSRRGDDALALAKVQELDLVILDVALPGLDGLGVAREIRRRKKPVKILMLSALGTVEDRVAGLDAGADDYLVKPFAFEELLARVRALSRTVDQASSTQLVCADLVIDLLARQVTRAGKIIDLSPKEYALLEYLLRHQGRPVTRTMIAEHVWNLDFHTSTNVIDVYVAYLRKKIDQDFEPKLLTTLRGRGYQLGDSA